MAVSGLTRIRGISMEEETLNAVTFAFGVLEGLRDYNEKNNERIEIRIGIHTGPALSTVFKNSCFFELFGGTRGLLLFTH